MRRLILAVCAAAAALPLAPALAGGGCHPFDTRTQPGPRLVLARGCEFEPAELRVPVGATVTWFNADVGPHTVTRHSSFDGIIDRGESYSFRFDRPGTYQYVCVYHPQMVGTVIAGDGDDAKGLPDPAALVGAAGDPGAASASPGIAVTPVALGAGTAGVVVGALGERARGRRRAG